jgi:hypothetical protein
MLLCMQIGFFINGTLIVQPGIYSFGLVGCPSSQKLYFLK